MALLVIIGLWVAVSLPLALVVGRAFREAGGRAFADEVELYLRRITRTPRRRSTVLGNATTAAMLAVALLLAAAGSRLPMPSVAGAPGDAVAFLRGSSDHGPSRQHAPTANAGAGARARPPAPRAPALHGPLVDPLPTPSAATVPADGGNSAQLAPTLSAPSVGEGGDTAAGPNESASATTTTSSTTTTTTTVVTDPGTTTTTTTIDPGPTDGGGNGN